ncbi:hypothetical protein [Legionella tunisiensis]|uniref:hypothetical protein n=1 Tax=Legionella tunisiensis TaxID=1034944 RepID=UPI0003818FE8|nr:hypothetical protein [Legionella tunisiensis]
MCLVLAIPVLACYGAFSSAYTIVNTISPEPIVDDPVKHSYHHFASTQEELLYKPSGKSLKHAKEEEPSSPYSRGLNFFAPLLKCLRSLGNRTDSRETDYYQNTQSTVPSPQSNSRD